MTNTKTLATILLAGAVFLLPGNVLAQQAPVPQQSRSCADQASLDQIAEQWKSAYNQGDSARVAALYTDDAYYLTQHFVTGIVHGRANIRAYVQSGVNAKYHIDSIQILSTDCAGNMAYSIDRYESTNGDQKAFGVNIVVIKKFGNEWLIVAHESAVPDPATAIKELPLDSR